MVGLGGHFWVRVVGRLRWNCALVREYLIVVVEEAHGLRMFLLFGEVRAEW